MTTATMSSIGIQYDLSGAGPAVLFLNGLYRRAAHWAYQRRALESRYRVITFDHRDKPAERGCCISQMADDAVAVLDHLGIERTHVVGQSIGSLVAQELALSHPHRVRSLTLACAWSHDGRLSDITQPALVLAGTGDTLTPPRLSLALARALPNARFKRLPGGHGITVGQSDRFNEILLTFLAWTGAASA